MYSNFLYDFFMLFSFIKNAAFITLLKVMIKI